MAVDVSGARSKSAFTRSADPVCTSNSVSHNAHPLLSFSHLLLEDFRDIFFECLDSDAEKRDWASKMA
eukprot:CAMPEP_0202836424 /NCGR_PEP_ID=MMETSP1389-20130828/41311_1 /ASSEMBLY_ACC=CAM_ASM_000865 /TAXON_ID=302021 /ORGANISM="Rhodomonas sp., Strain CCMP768" /LENGTH=67 /DNA_ID=CAMNT_0049512223 /DNA_START=1 /DNA_END=200 /DNA_ORIENTATION=+